MPEQISIMALPFLACLILTGIHVYLGIHVISRKVIFVDIALAQIAAVGATVAFVLGADPKTEKAYWFSLGFAVLAAAIFAVTRTRAERVPQEAIIGLTYAVASAAAILLADLSPHGAEHLKDLMAGSIVWVTPGQLIKTGILYTIIGAFHYVFRERFLLISINPEEAYARGIRVRLWDFFFYLSFGVVITSAVQIAGVLLVFCYLVAPAVFAIMFSDKLRTRLVLGWIVATFVSAAGLYLSYDRPSGPTIMICFAVVLILGGILRAIMTAPNRMRAGVLALACVAIVAATGYAIVRFGGSSEQGDHHHGDGSSHAAEAAQGHEIGDSSADILLALRDSHPGVRAKAVDELAASGAQGAAVEIAGMLKDSSIQVRENAAKALGVLRAVDAIAALKQTMADTKEDEWVRLRASQTVALMGDSDALAVLLGLAHTGETRLARLGALSSLAAAAGVTPASGGPDAANLGAGETDALAKALGKWLELNVTSLRWDASTKTYLPHASRM